MRILTLVFSAVLTASLFTSNALAWRTTDIDSHVDPAYTSFQPKKIAFLVSGGVEFTKEAEKQLHKYLTKKYGVAAVNVDDLLPPTREWTDQEVTEVFASNRIDSMVMVTQDGYDQRRETVNTGSTTTSRYRANTNVYSNGSYARANTYGNSNSQTINQNMVIASDSGGIQLKLLEAGSGNTVWMASVATKARGTAFVGEDGAAKASVKKMVKDWEERGFISKK